MNMKKNLILPAMALCLSAALISPASALEYTIDTDKAPAYGSPTSFEPVITEDGGKRPNVDLSKAAALIPPGFGSPTSYLLNSGEYLTPDLVPGRAAQGAVTGGSGAVVTPPSFDGAAAPSQSLQSSNQGSVQSPVQGGVAYPAAGFTEVTSALYYSGGYLGTLKIPSQNVNVKIYQGTSDSALAKGAGHFSGTSIWAGNVAIAGHNRGAHGIFGEIHNLKMGDKITLTTKLGTRTYSVTTVSKVSETDRSGLEATAENCITIYTCVRNESPYRWCVRAVEVV